MAWSETLVLCCRCARQADRMLSCKVSFPNWFMSDLLRSTLSQLALKPHARSLSGAADGQGSRSWHLPIAAGMSLPNPCWLSVYFDQCAMHVSSTKTCQALASWSPSTTSSLCSVLTGCTELKRQKLQLYCTFWPCQGC